MASTYLDQNNLEEAKKAAMALIRSTQKQNWVSLGRHILERIEEELSVKKGVIGCLLPLSGPFSIYGQEVLNGIQLGMDIFNRPEANRGSELIIKDTRGNPKKAVSLVEHLAEKDKVIAIIGPLASKSATAAAKKAQELGIPIITLTQKVGITSEGTMVFRNFLTPPKETKKIVEKAMGEFALKKFGILYPDNSYGQFFMNLFWDEVEDRGGSITAVESYQPGEADFAVEIKKMVGLYYPRPPSVLAMIKEMRAFEAEEKIENNLTIDEEPLVDFDAVFIPDNYQHVAQISPQFPFYNIFNIRLLGTSLWQSPELIETASDYVQGAIFPSGFFAESPVDDVKDFVTRYQENFESKPGILAATGYDTIRFLEDLLENHQIRTRQDFRDALMKHDHFHGVTGKISFNDQGEVEKEPILLTISGKNFQILH
jgi:ABC-type branched-subunit amino acid transport system substrate-binding protein